MYPSCFGAEQGLNTVKVAVSVGSAHEGAMLLWLYFEM